MDQKHKIFIGLFLLFIFSIIYSDYGSTFFLSIALTLTAEASLAYYLWKNKPKFIEISDKNISADEDDDSFEEIQSSIMRHSNRRKSTIPCLCSSENFKSLCSGNETIMSEFHSKLKLLISNDKNFQSNLEKAIDKPMLERFSLKSKGLLVDLWKSLQNICKFYSEDCKELEDSLLVSVKLLEKDTKKRHKDLAEKMKKNGEKFKQENENLDKFLGKTEKNKKLLEEAKEILDAGGEASIEAKLKLESRIKILTNKLSKNKHRIEITKDNLVKESSGYLENTRELFTELKEINKMKGESHRSYIQYYLTTIQNLWKQSHNELSSFADMNSSLNESTLRTLPIEDELEKSFSKRSAEKLIELKESFNKLDKLIETFSSIESDYMNKFIGHFENWELTQDIGLESGFFDFLHSIEILTENLQDFQKECEFIRTNIKSHIKVLNMCSDFSEEAMLNQIGNFSESRRLFFSILLSNYSEKIKIISTGARYFETIDEIKEMYHFSKEADRHDPLCPYYKYLIINESESRTSGNEAESAIWLNNLLMVYIEEWRTSDKFQVYICRKIAKKLNKDNPKAIGNITVSDFKYDGPPPTVRDFLSKSDNPSEFNYEFWVTVNGEITFNIVVPVDCIAAVLDIKAMITVTDFAGKLRICYTSYRDDQSWYSFSEMPNLSLSVFPLVFDSYLNINQIPVVKWLLEKAINLKLSNYIYPKKRSIKIIKGRPKREQYP